MSVEGLFCSSWDTVPPMAVVITSEPFLYECYMNVLTLVSWIWKQWLALGEQDDTKQGSVKLVWSLMNTHEYILQTS